MPTKPENEYLKSLFRARNQALAVNVEAQRKILQSLHDAILRIDIDHAAGAMSPAQAERMRRQFKKLYEGYNKAFAKTIKDGTDLTIQRVTAIHDSTVANLMKEQGIKFDGLNFDSINDFTYRNLAMRRGAATMTSIAAFHSAEALRQIDSFLGQAVARGVPSGRAGIDLAKILAGDDPALIEAVNKLPRGLQAMRRGGLNTVNWDKYGIDPNQVTQVKNTLYNARRITVSELHNAHREASAQAMVESPVVDGVKWQTSGRHHIVDECDILAEEDMYNMGSGVYPPQKFPVGPHPHCACYPGGVTQRPVSEWGKPKGPVPKIKTSPQWFAWNFAQTLNWSPARLARAKKTIGNVVSLAEESHKLTLAGVTSPVKATKKKAAKKAAPKHTQIPEPAKPTPLKMDWHDDIIDFDAKGPAAPKLTEADVTFKQLQGPGGSNPGGVYLGKDGKHRYVKFYKDEAQAYGEQLANDIYNKLGLQAPNSIVIRAADGRYIHAAEMMEMHGTLGTNLSKAHAEKVLRGLGGDILTANWDAVGLSLDNVVLLKNGGVARIDQGGAFLMRAQQGRKSTNMLNAIYEWEGFFDPSINAAYRKVAQKAGIASADDLGMILVKQIDDIMLLKKQVGGWAKYVDDVIPGLNATDKKAIVQMLETRTKLLYEKSGHLAVKAVQEAKAAESIAAAKKAMTDAQKLANQIEKAKKKVLLLDANITKQAYGTEAYKLAIAEHKKAVKALNKLRDKFKAMGSVPVPSGVSLSKNGAKRIDQIVADRDPRIAARTSINRQNDKFINDLLEFMESSTPNQSFSKLEDIFSDWRNMKGYGWRGGDDASRERIFNFLQMIQSWQGGSHTHYRNKLRQFMAGTLKNDSAVRDLAVMLDGADPSKAPKVLKRGMNIKGVTPEQVMAEYNRHGVIDLGPSSFSIKQNIADKFAGSTYTSGSYRSTAVELVVHGPKKAINIQALAQSGSYHAEAEWIMGGRFRVLKVEKLANGRVRVELQQLATFEPDTPVKFNW